ncbi:Gfo/Idh/MocA family oxidoreductase [Candidatus Peregrinibacteria bacterium]|nr:Gfo/Idh/MocA family oxidoreductase [Candidatus Peregrinibacteria bacterium]
MKILIAGAGSIGQRHARNLRTIGAGTLAVFEPDAAKRTTISQELSCDSYNNFDEALRSMKPDVVFVCSPTKFHVAQALAAAKAGAHLFIEKPLNHTMDGVDALSKEIEKNHLICMVGCNMRFHHGPRTVKKLLVQGEIGPVKNADITVVFNFTGRADFEGKLEKYSKSYNADPSQGGATRECVHEIDLALWYSGPATLKSATKEMAGRIGLPAIEGASNLMLQHENGVVSNVHLSIMEPVYRRGCTIQGEKGSIEWSFGGDVIVRDTSGAITASYPQPQSYEVNQMYIDEILYFFDCMKKNVTPQGNLDDATRALAVALETIERAEERATVIA